MDQRGGRARQYFLFAGAVLLFLLTIWVVVPAPTYPLLIVAIGAPESGIWLIAGAALIALAGLHNPTRSWTTRATTFVAVATIALAAFPFVRFPATAHRFDAAMHAALGEDYLCAVPEGVRRSMRHSPLNPVELVTGLRGGTARVTRGIRFTVTDGIPLTMDIYRPSEQGSHPSVVQIYGGAWLRGGPGENAEFATYLASHGYVVFAIDYRHAPRWQWPAQLADVRSALGWIGVHGREYGADPARMAILGRSSGAQLAMVGAYAPGGPQVRAVVSFYGPVDLAEGYRHPPRPDPLHVRTIEEAFLGGAPDAVPGRYRDASPVTYVVRPLPPTLLVYGAGDHVVEPRFGTMLHERLAAAGTTSVLLEVPWSEHAFDAVTGGPGAQLALYHTERFLAWALRSSDSTACAAAARLARHHLQ
ncbi:MAG: alpha/beta hydrolase [Gemmatimonadales bacterium]